MSKINLNYQFELYLSRVGVSQEMIPEFQYTEMKRAFMGGIGQLLVILRFEQMAIKPETDHIETIEDMLLQIDTYWKAEVQKDIERRKDAGE